MVRCPICRKALSPFEEHPYAPICSERCRRTALRRLGMEEAESSDSTETEGAMEQFQQLKATHLYCSTCRQSMPTKERLLLILPGSRLYDYTCARCGTEVGTKTDTSGGGVS